MRMGGSTVRCWVVPTASACRRAATWPARRLEMSASPSLPQPRRLSTRVGNPRPVRTGQPLPPSPLVIVGVLVVAKLRPTAWVRSVDDLSDAIRREHQSQRVGLAIRGDEGGQYGRR